MWSDIRLFFSRDRLLYPECSDKACSILAERLIRCRSAPRDVTIDAPYLHLQEHPVFRLMLMHTDSWRSLDINTNTVNYVFLQTRRGFFSSLESLRISDMEFYDSQDATYNKNALDVFSIVPSMTLLDVPDIPVTGLTIAPAANTSIQSLGITLAGQGVAVMNTLRSMTWLSTLELTCNETISYMLDIVDLVALRRLLLRDPLSTNSIPHLWRKIHVPSLTCLALGYEDEDVDRPAYPSLLTPHTSITDFRLYLESDIDNAELCESALVALLCNLPNVTSLDLQSSSPWPIVVDELYNHADFLPRLTRLRYLVDAPLKNAAACAFVQMLYHRKTNCSCMRIYHLSIVTYPIMDQITQHRWDSILNDEVQPMEVVRVYDTQRYASRAFMAEVE